MGGLGTLGYVIATPRTEEMFTSFYILGLDGKAVDYPLEIVAGEEGKVMVGIMNHKYQAMSYRVKVRIDEVKNNEVYRQGLLAGAIKPGRGVFLSQAQQLMSLPEL